MIAVLLPSRGLVHSRTMQDILANVLGTDLDVGFYFSHGNNIPDSHNLVVEEAMKDKPDYLWLVEDDMQLPPGILKELLEAHTDIALADYPVRGDQHSVTRNKDGEFLYGGLGCVLIKKKVFKEKLAPPFFRTDYSYTPDMEQVEPMGNHGLLDVDFYQQCKWARIEVKVINMTAGHYFLKSPELPKFGNDTGSQYKVETWSFSQPWK